MDDLYAIGVLSMCIINDQINQLEKAHRIELVSTTSACEFLGISRTTLWRISQRDATFPRPMRIALNKNSWNIDELNNWAKNQ